MNILASVASSILPSGIGSAVGSIFGQAAKSVLGGANPLNLLGSAFDAFGQIFGRQRVRQPQGFFPPLPLPFSPGPGFPINPFGILQRQPSLGLLNQLNPTFQNALQLFNGAPGLAASVGTGLGGVRPIFDGSSNTFNPGTRPVLDESVFSGPDKFLADAQKLMQPGPNGEPPSQANMFKAQQLISAAGIMGDLISKLLQKSDEIAKKVFQNT